MADDTPTPPGNIGDLPVWEPDDNQPLQPPQPPPVRKRRRRWPWVVVAIVLLLAVVVALAPWIASTRWGRAVVVGQVNKRLNGQVEVADWSLSWKGGTEVHGVRIFQDGAQILELRRLVTELSLWDVIRGNFDFGQTKVEELDFVARQYADGTNNWQRLLKQAEAPDRPGRPGAPEGVEAPREAERVERAPVAKGEAEELPNIRGNFDIDFRGTIEQPDAPAIVIDRSTAALSIPDVNSPWSHRIDLNVRVAGENPGNLQAEGSIDAVRNNRLELATLSANERVRLTSVNLASVMPFLKPGGPIGQLAGVTDGEFEVRLAGEDEMVVSGRSVSAGFAVGGEALRGDTYTTPTLVIDIPETVVSRSSGRIRIGEGSEGEQLVIEVEEGTIRVSADATYDSVLRVARNERPGEQGRVSGVVDLELGGLAKKLPNALRFSDELKEIRSGRLENRFVLALEPERALMQEQLRLTELAVVTKDDREVRPEAVGLTLAASSLGGGGAVPELRDLQIELESGFAKVSGGGESVADLSIAGGADLGRLYEQFRYLVEIPEMSGAVAFRVATQGDLTRAGSSAKLAMSASVTGVKVALAENPIDQRWVEVGLEGEMVRGEEQFLQVVRDAVATLKSGDRENPTVDARVLGDVALGDVRGQTGVSVPRFEIAHLVANLPAAERDFAPYFEPLRERGLSLPRGTVAVEGSGSYDGTTATLSALKISPQRVTLARAQEKGRAAPVLRNYSGTLELAGVVKTGAEGLDARLSTLSWSDTQEMVMLRRAGEEELTIRVDPDGNAALNGRVELGADLKMVNDVLRAFTEEVEVVATTPEYEIDRGRVSGVFDVAHAGGREMRIAGDLKALDLHVRTPGEMIREEEVAIVLRATAAGDWSSIAAERLDLTSSFANVRVSDAAMRLPREGEELAAADMLQRANAAFDVPDLPRLMAFVEALGPRAAAAEAEASAEELPPIEVRSGSIAGALRVERDEKQLIVTLDEVVGRQIGLVRGRETAPRGVGVRISGRMLADPPGAKAAETLTIEKLTFEVDGGRTLTGALTGRVRDYDSRRRFDDMQLVLGYDAAAVLQVIEPLLLPEQRENLKALEVEGVARDRVFAITGGYPTEEVERANQAQVYEPLRKVKASGSIGLGRIAYQGMATEEPVEWPVMLADGKLRIAQEGRGRAQYPAPVKFSGGLLDAGGLEMDVVGEVTKISSLRRDHRILSDVQVTGPFLEMVLGQAHPLFTKVVKADGSFTLVINELDSLPLGEALLAEEQQGRAAVTFTLADMALRSGLLDEVVNQTKLNLGGVDWMVGEIRDAKVRIAEGQVHSDIAMNLRGRVIAFPGGVVRLSDQRIVSMKMQLPKELIPVVRDQRFLRPVIEVPITGTLSKPQFDIVQVALRSLVPQSPLDLLRGLDGRREEREVPEERRPEPREERRRDRREQREPEEPPPGTIGRPRARDGR